MLAPTITRAPHSLTAVDRSSRESVQRVSATRVGFSGGTRVRDAQVGVLSSTASA